MDWFKEHLSVSNITGAFMALVGAVGAWVGLKGKAQAAVIHAKRLEKELDTHRQVFENHVSQYNKLERRVDLMDASYQNLMEKFDEHIEEGKAQRKEILEAIKEVGQRLETKVEESLQATNREVRIVRSRVHKLSNAVAITKAKLDLMDSRSREGR